MGDLLSLTLFVCFVKWTSTKLLSIPNNCWSDRSFCWRYKSNKTFLTTLKLKPVITGRWGALSSFCEWPVTSNYNGTIAPGDTSPDGAPGKRSENHAGGLIYCACFGWGGNLKTPMKPIQTWGEKHAKSTHKDPHSPGIGYVWNTLVSVHSVKSQSRKMR